MDWGQFVELLLKAALAAALPIAVAYVREWLKQQRESLEQHLGSDRWWAVEEAIKTAVSAAEQSGIRDGLEEAGERKLQRAIHSAEAFLAARGLEGLDLDVLKDLIEAEVHKQFNGK